MSGADDPQLAGLGGTPVSAPEQVRRVADMQARIATQDQAIQASLPAEGGNPEVKEYVRRWNNFRAEVNTLQEQANSWWHSLSDEEIALSEGRLNNLVREWNEILPLAIANRRQKAQIKILQEGVQHTTPAKSGEPHTPIKLPDAAPAIQPSATTSTPIAPPPPPPPPAALPTGVKVGIVGGAALGAIVATATARSDAARAGIGVVGLGAVAGLAWWLFSPNPPASPQTPPTQGGS